MAAGHLNNARPLRSFPPGRHILTRYELSHRGARRHDIALRDNIFRLRGPISQEQARQAAR